MASPSNLAYTPLPLRAEIIAEQLFHLDDQIHELVAEFMHVKPRPENKEGDSEVL
jgi:hypothetical protein